ncbi:MAG: GGDEF domain-containing protein [Proteobacteria bacterium]|nr:GGDEF domain-containing protein [Pseudomonadota bacterium]
MGGGFRIGTDGGFHWNTQTANRLRNCVREIDTVARFGGDEFVVILSDLNAEKAESKLQAQVIAEKVLAALSEPYLLSVSPDGEGSMVMHRCTASLGVTVFIDHESSRDDILKYADTAMYQAKESGRNQILFYAIANCQ